jgi:predicted dehydrogenase
MSHPVLKLGFIGGGLNSAIGLTHRIAAQMDGHFQLCAGCFSRDPEISRATGAAWGVEADRIYASPESLLAREADKLDAVAILTPTPAHRDILLQCAKTGLHVICEKMLAMNSTEITEIEAAFSRSSRERERLFVTYNYTGYPMIRELRARIRQGFLGDIQQIMAEMPQEGFLRQNADGNVSPPQAWRRQDGAIPTVSLDLGVHLHHLVKYLIAEDPAEVYAAGRKFGGIDRILDTIHCVANHTSGILCNYWYGKTALGYRNGLRIRIFGSRGAAEWHQMEPEFLRIANERGEQFVMDRTHVDNLEANKSRYQRFKAGHPAGFIEAFANHYADLAAWMVENKSREHIFGMQWAKEGGAFLEAVSESIRSGRPVTLDRARPCPNRGKGLPA